MSAVITAEVVSRTVNILISTLLADKIEAAVMNEIAKVIGDAIEGKITDDQAIEQLRPKAGDSLDKALGNS